MGKWQRLLRLDFSTLNEQYQPQADAFQEHLPIEIWLELFIRVGPKHSSTKISHLNGQNFEKT